MPSRRLATVSDGTLVSLMRSSDCFRDIEPSFDNIRLIENAWRDFASSHKDRHFESWRSSWEAFTDELSRNKLTRNIASSSGHQSPSIGVFSTDSRIEIVGPFALLLHQGLKNQMRYPHNTDCSL